MDIDEFPGGIRAAYLPNGTYEVLSGPEASNGAWRGFRAELAGYTVVWPAKLKAALQAVGHEI